MKITALSVQIGLATIAARQIIKLPGVQTMFAKSWATRFFLAAGMAGTAGGALAVDPVSSASLTMSNLTVKVTDLVSWDGVPAGVTFAPGKWLINGTLQDNQAIVSPRYEVLQGVLNGDMHYQSSIPRMSLQAGMTGDPQSQTLSLSVSGQVEAGVQVVLSNEFSARLTLTPWTMVTISAVFDRTGSNLILDSMAGSAYSLRLEGTAGGIFYSDLDWDYDASGVLIPGPGTFNRHDTATVSFTNATANSVSAVFEAHGGFNLQGTLASIPAVPEPQVALLLLPGLLAVAAQARRARRIQVR